MPSSRSSAPFDATQPGLRRPIIWWIVWGVILAESLPFYLLVEPREPLPALEADPAAAPPVLEYVGLLPLALSIVLRWVVLPLQTRRTTAFIVFIAGIVLAEAGMFLGLFFGTVWRDEIFALGVLGVAQFMPLFIRKYVE